MLLKLSKPAKVGKSFDLAAIDSCPGATEICRSQCYTLVGRMAIPSNVQRRKDQLGVVQDLLERGKLVDALVLLMQDEGTVRIHSSGDFFSAEYVQAWIEAAQQMPTKFWAYTRSWSVAGMTEPLSRLAALPNVSVWLSCDESNWMQCLTTYAQHPQFAGIAFMQTTGCEEISQVMAARLPKANLVIFPAHHASGLRKGVTVADDVPNCPDVIGKLPESKLPACLLCRKCLPKSATA